MPETFYTKSAVDGAWTSITLLAGWANFNASNNYDLAQYKLVAGKRVLLRGMIVQTDTTKSIICTLPTALRPLKNVFVPTIVAGEFGVLDIRPSGNVELNGRTASNWLNLSASFSLD